jgi:hypothetical protein
VTKEEMACEKERISVFYGTQKEIKQKEMWMWDFERGDEDQQGENSKEQEQYDRKICS